MSDGIVFRAAWVVPVIGPPTRDGWVAVSNGRITASGDGVFDKTLERSLATPGDSGSKRTADHQGTYREIDLGNVALLPGLINAHTHLELSWLRGHVPPSPSMPDWVRALMQARAAGADDGMSVDRALDEAIACGTVAVGDVANSLVSVGPLIRRGLPSVIFHEVLGFDPADATDRATAARDRLQALSVPDRIRFRLAPHAPYSTSAELIQALLRVSSPSTWPRTSIHVAESADEVEFLASGEGSWRALLNDLHIRTEAWQPPRLSPVAYLDTLGVWQAGSLAVHCVHATERELDLLAARDVTVVTCPRSNAWVGAGDPPIDRFVSSGVRLAVGTDSLASAPDLNLFSELHRLRVLAPDVSARTLLSCATINGARALGMDDQWGSFLPGRQARFLAVEVGHEIADVEAALVEGVQPEQVRWIDECSVLSTEH